MQVYRTIADGRTSGVNFLRRISCSESTGGLEASRASSALAAENSSGSIMVDGGIIRTRGMGLSTCSEGFAIAGKRDIAGLAVGGDRRAGWMCR